jgi:hypothetical protein
MEHDFFGPRCMDTRSVTGPADSVNRNGKTIGARCRRRRS